MIWGKCLEQQYVFRVKSLHSIVILEVSPAFPNTHQTLCCVVHSILCIVNEWTLAQRRRCSRTHAGYAIPENITQRLTTQRVLYTLVAQIRARTCRVDG